MKSEKFVMCYAVLLFFSFVAMAAAGSEGDTNTFYGTGAGVSNTSGTLNTFIGANAGYYNTSGYQNSFIGQSAGQSNTTGSYNAFHGQGAGQKNTTGMHNCFLGQAAGYSNTIGNHNAFVGTAAGYDNTTAAFNTFVGVASGRLNTTGGYNSFLGQGSGYSNKGGGLGNTFVGYCAGYSNDNGQKNVCVGFQAGFNETGSNKLYIDNSDTATPLIWGDFNTNNVVIYGGFRAIASYSSSDERLKKNIQPLQSSLEKVAHLKGIAYEWRKDDFPGMGLTEGKQIGLIAQDVEKEMPELVSEDKDGYKAISYTRLTAVLVEAIKELKTLNEKQQAEIERLRELIKELKG